MRLRRLQTEYLYFVVETDATIIGKLSRVLSRIIEIFIESLNKNVTEFLNVRKFREILH